MTTIKLDAIDSTSSYLSALWRQGLFAPPVAVYTYHQTAGRGRRGDLWQSEANKNLTISFLIDFKTKSLKHSFGIVMQTALTVVRFLEEFQVPELKIKWPNDIMSGDQKLCGILVERALQGAQSSPFVVGIGINVNQEDFESLPHATSMKLRTEKTYDLDTLSSALVHQIENTFEQQSLQDELEVAQLLSQFNKLLYAKGQFCAVTIDQHLNQKVKILEVTDEGNLRVEDLESKQFLLESASVHFDYAEK